MSKSKLQLVHVEWLDIKSESGWFRPEVAAAFEPIKCRDVGWVLRHDERALVLARSRNDEGDVGDVCIIPAGCVVRVTRMGKVVAKASEDGSGPQEAR